MFLETLELLCDDRASFSISKQLYFDLLATPHFEPTPVFNCSQQGGARFDPTTNVNYIHISDNFFQHLNDNFPSGLQAYNQYERRLYSAHADKARLQFLKSCLDECVLPRTIPKSDNVLHEAFPEQDRIALQQHIIKQRRLLGARFEAVRHARNAYRLLM